jgi:hypothetical protein
MIEQKQHAKLSASGSETWLNCAGSVNAQLRYENKSSRYAIEGTFAHELADLCLKNNLPALNYLNETLTIKDNDIIKTLIVTEKMANYVQEYVNYVNSYTTSESVLYTENKVDFSNYVPDGFGTLDSAVYLPETETLHIFDLKYGKGVKVTAEKNTQGMLYALGMINELDGLDRFEDVYIHIIQPRIPSLTHYKTSRTELLEWSKYVSERAKMTMLDDAPRTAGDKQCKWCLARKECEAFKNLTLDKIIADFDDI